MSAARRRSARRLMQVRDAVLGGSAVFAATAMAPVLGRHYRRWGATDDEVSAQVPGDDLVPDPLLGYTRAVTVDAPVERVWPWLVQIGQGRGGLYSYDGLENLVGCRMHSAEALLPEHQQLHAGDTVRLGPDGYPFFTVHAAQPPTSLVLLGGPPDDPATRATWQWWLRPLGREQTRVVVRQRLAFPASQRLLWRLLEPVSFVMERRMLHGLRRRVQTSDAPAV